LCWRENCAVFYFITIFYAVFYYCFFYIHECLRSHLNLTDCVNIPTHECDCVDTRTRSNESFIGLNKSHTALLRLPVKRYVCNRAFPFGIYRSMYFTNCFSRHALELPVNSDSRLIESAIVVAFDRRCQHVTMRQ